VESVEDILRGRLAAVEARIAAACDRSGRRREDVTLVAVTKTVGVEVARALLKLGVVDLAESRPQELWTKAEAIPDARWHLVGHLQRNKVERTVPLAAMIHAVDSVRLLEEIEAACRRRCVHLPVLLEVNASGEAAKQGFAPDEVAALADTINAVTAVRVCGLMTMAAYVEDQEATRPTFALLRGLLGELRERCPGHALGHLSMGMSNDFEVAIEEGATLIRLGTVLFEGLDSLREGLPCSP